MTSITACKADVPAISQPRAQFFRFLTAASSSNLGDGMSYVIIPLLAIKSTNSEFLISLVPAARTLPLLIFTLVVGIFADRYSKSKIMKFTNAMRFIVFFVLSTTFYLNAFNIYLLIALSFVIGIFETAHDTTMESITPELVEKSRLDHANGRLAMAEHIANNCLGSPIASMLAAISLPLAILSNGFTYLLGLIFLWPIRTRKVTIHVSHSIESTLQQIKEGLAFIRTKNQLATLVMMSATWNFTIAAVNAMLAPLVIKEMGAPDWTLGIVLLMYAGGRPAGMLLEKIIKHLGRTRAIRLCYIAYAVAIPMIPTFMSVPIVCLMVAVIGFTSVIFGASWRTYRQAITPPALIGRVNALCRVVSLGVMPLGALFAGIVADMASVIWLYRVLGAISLIGLYLAFASLNRAEVDSSV